GGCVLAADVTCAEGHPPFSRSAMDGYAVRAGDAAEAGAKLKLAETVKAGTESKQGLAAGTCIKIMTGAPVPDGADTVVMQEYTQEEGGTVTFGRPAEKGRHIRYAGEDIAPGGVAASKGTLLAPQVIGTCALVGAVRLKVYRKPVVAVLATGDEIIEPDDPRPGGAFIRNANGPMLLALLRERGVEGRYLGIAPDEPEALKAMILEGLESDLLLITGGVSVGQFDYVPQVVAQLGLEYVFRKVRVKPGKPSNYALGARGKVFGIPGNPVSVYTTFHIFIRPMLRKMTGMRGVGTVYQGSLAAAYRSDAERLKAAPCTSEFARGAYRLTPVKLNGSADLAGAGRANALAFIPAENRMLDAGETVRFIKTGEDS
ncbi:MAG: gephyrin-like molybdotransferase Glp, partial [Pseudomonadota bacterium]